MLTINQLDVRIGHRILAPNFEAQWQTGSLVAVLGPNGAGKSTLLHHIAGLALREPGKVLLDGSDVFTMPAAQRARRIASIAQQDACLFETLVRDRIAHGLYARQAKDEAKHVTTIARSLEIDDLLDRPLHTLSGGQRKKVHIARALVDDEAEVYVLDEPDASLDAASREHVMSLLKARANRDKLVITSLHHHDLAERYADQSILLSRYAS